MTSKNSANTSRPSNLTLSSSSHISVSPASLPPTMPRKWASVPLLLLWSACLALAGPAFENTAIVRSADVGGTVVHVTTTYAVRSLEGNVKTYTIALGTSEREKTSWIEVKVKGQDKALPYTERVEECVLWR